MAATTTTTTTMGGQLEEEGDRRQAGPSFLFVTQLVLFRRHYLVSLISMYDHLYLPSRLLV